MNQRKARMARAYVYSTTDEKAEKILSEKMGLTPKQIRRAIAMGKRKLAKS